MRVLVLGGGGREHALVWSLLASAQTTEVLVAPGNGGTATMADNVRNVAVDLSDLDALVALVEREAVDLTVVGPEDPLVAGVVDRFDTAGLRIFGPSAAVAQLEGSKSFANEFMARHGIPTAASATFDDLDAALAHLDTLDQVPVIKADGLAAGKGVILPTSMGEAVDALREMLVDHRFGKAGARVVIEERLQGIEASVLAFCDGTDLAIMPIAQDHKRLGDGDAGPNTGGMGAFVPSPVVDADVLAEVEARILRPVLAGMAAEGTPYVGVLYAGIMIGDHGISVIEFNCRFGDPETQVVLPLLQSDIVDIFGACIDGRLRELSLDWSNQAAVTVVLASRGYPGAYETGCPIAGVGDVGNDVIVFHAGTSIDAGGELVTAGGRVLAVTALGDDPEAAAGAAYAGVERIQSDCTHRSDIGRPANRVATAGATP